MFAVIKTGGKQYKVSENDKLVVEKLQGSLGEIIKLDEVLLIDEGGKPPAIGTPFLENAGVFAEVVDQAKSKKVLVFKKKRRQNYRRTKGHRQEQTILKILEISPTGNQTVSASKKVTAEKKSPKKVLEKSEGVDPTIKPENKLKKDSKPTVSSVLKEDLKSKILKTDGFGSNQKKIVKKKINKKVEDVKSQKSEG